MKLFIGLLLVALPAWAAESPRYQLSLKNGADLPAVLSEGAWAKDFRQSNLFEGLTLRLAPLLGTLPAPSNTTWKGRIADSLIELALKNRPVHLYHFHAAELVQPTAVAVQGLTAVEKSALRAIVESLRTTGDQGGVTPISVSDQKIAVKLEGECAAISRDPKVAEWAWALCAKEPALAADGLLRVNVKSLSAGTEKALLKYLGLGTELSVELVKSGAGEFTVSKAKLPLNPSHRLASAKMSEARLKALPASTELMTAIALPAPKSLSVEDLKALIALKPSEARKGRTLVATYFSLGTYRHEELGPITESGVLFERAAGFSAEDWAKAFDSSGPKEAFVKEVCGGELILVTPVETTIAKVEAACAGKEPSLTNLPADMKAVLQSEGAQTAMVNVGRALSRMVDLGWAIDNTQKSETMPAEVMEAKKLLSRIPACVLGGVLGANEINYQAKLGVF